MARIKFANDAGGTGEAILTINPYMVEIPQVALSASKNSVQSSDGEAVTFTPYFDSRRGKLVWKGFPADHAGFASVLSAIESYVGGYKYMDLEDIGAAVVAYQTYTKIKVISVDKYLRPGGRLTYDRVEFIWEDAEV